MSLFDRLTFSIPAFSVAPVLTRTNKVLEVAHIFTKHSKFFVLTMSSCAFISLLYEQLLHVHSVEIFHCTIRFINQISKEVPYETFSYGFYSHKIVYENTLL